jgi:peptidoglycan-associated lipoprotein
MISTRSLVRGAALGASLVLLAACRKKPETGPTPLEQSAARALADSAASARRTAESATARPAPAAPRPVAPDPVSTTTSRGTATSAVAGTGPVTEAERKAAEAARVALLERIYFAYDDDDISADQRAVLDAKLPILLANPRLRIRIAGHTDERGADEYNLALGQRRAASVKRYFSARGVTEDRIETVSFGREHPLSDAHNEDSWAKNRRGEFEIIAGGETLRAPR